jgi:hypothetical protein
LHNYAGLYIIIVCIGFVWKERAMMKSLILCVTLCVMAGMAQAMPVSLILDFQGVGLQDERPEPTQDFDRYACERDCRRRFGMTLYFAPAGGSHTSGYQGLAECVQECNTQYWKEFDRRTREIESPDRFR